MASVGVGEDVAATGIAKMITTMTAGSAATEKQSKVLKKLGIDATALADRMQTDAQGAIIDFMEALQKLPKAEQAAALKNYFGQESIKPISALYTNLDELKKHFDQVADASLYDREQHPTGKERPYAPIHYLRPDVRTLCEAGRR